MGPLKTYYCQEIEKWLRSHPGQVVTIYQIGELFGNAYKRAARGEIAANGFRATGRFPCDKKIFRPHDLPLTSEDTEATPLNHPALVKTSDETFSFVNFSPFTSTEALRSSDISHVPSLNVVEQQKKITSSPPKKLLRQRRKRK